MTYFSNSTEADTFQHNWCSRCRNWRDRAEEGYDGEGEGCPVMDLHFVYSHGPDGRLWLDRLIADTEPAGERRCHLFVRGAKR